MHNKNKLTVYSLQFIVRHLMDKPEQSKGYKDLLVWQKAIDLVECIYRHTEDFPKREWYGLTSQMRESAVSIPSNIAEGSKRHTKKDFYHFLSISYGSAAELETQLIIADRLGYGKKQSQDECMKLLDEVLRMLHKLRLSLT